MTLTGVLLAEAETTYAITERLFRRVADDELHWAPSTGKGWMTLGQLLMHCSSFACGKAIRGFVSEDWGLDSAEREQIPPAEVLPTVVTVRQAIELLASDRNLAMDSIRAAGEASLLKHCPPPPWGGPELPLFQHLLHMIAHLAQHKGQLFYYLKLMGRDVKTADLWEA